VDRVPNPRKKWSLAEWRKKSDQARRVALQKESVDTIAPRGKKKDEMGKR